MGIFTDVQLVRPQWLVVLLRPVVMVLIPNNLQGEKELSRLFKRIHSRLLGTTCA